MKILHTTDSLDPNAGGPARSVPQLALAQAELGHEVALWCPGKAYSTLPDLNCDLPENLRLLSGRLKSAMRNFGTPDAFHDHGIWRLYHRRIAAFSRKVDTPIVVSPRGMLEPWAFNYKKAKKQLAWFLYQKRHLHSVTALHATAESEALQLRKLGFTQPVLTAANGVSIPTTGIRTEEPGESTPKTALFLSRLHPKKGLTLLIEAWRRAELSGWSMRVIGPSEDQHDVLLKRQVKAAGLSHVWKFEPSVTGQKKWKAMLEADLFILPSHSENFGIVIAEALACGTPVITTTGTPWQELTGRGCGWWVDPTVEALTYSLKEATSISAAERQEMGAIGREWMAMEFTWPAIAAKTIEFYSTLLES